MAWTGDLARVHCDVVSAETYLQNAVAVLEGMIEVERPPGVQGELSCALDHLGYAKAPLERGVSPEVLEALRGSVIPLEDP